MGIRLGVANEHILISPQCPSYTDGSQDLGSAKAVSLELSGGMFPECWKPICNGENEANSKGWRIWKRKPWQYHLILAQAVSEDEATCRCPKYMPYWWSGNLALPNSCILYFNDTNHEYYTISVEAKIAIGWIDQKTSKRWIICRTPKEKERKQISERREWYQRAESRAT